MDETLVVVLLCVFGVIIALIFRDMMIRNSEIRAEERLAKTGYYTQLGKRGADVRWGKKEEVEGEEAAELGPWVDDMLALVGMTTDVLFDDEMPPMLKKALPAIKGFLETSGGIEKIIGRFSAGEGGLGAPGTDGGAII